MKNLYPLKCRFSFLVMILWFCGVISAQPKMECSLTMPKELVFDSTHRTYVPNPFHVTVTLINKGDSSALNPKMIVWYTLGLSLVPDTVQEGWLIHAIGSKIGDTAMVCVFVKFSNHPDISCCEKIWIPPIITTDVESKENQLSSFYLGQNYPNPFTDYTAITLTRPSVTLSQWERVGVRVYDIFGREVLDLSGQAINNSTLKIQNLQLPSPGIYFYRLTVGNESQTKMMTMIK